MTNLTAEKQTKAKRSLVKRLRKEALMRGAELDFDGEGAEAIAQRTILWEAANRIEELERLDREAATHVESVICIRTNFTGEPPYVGWKGLGLALSEALDERDRARSLAEGSNTAGRQHPSKVHDVGSSPTGRAK